MQMKMKICELHMTNKKQILSAYENERVNTNEISRIFGIM